MSRFNFRNNFKRFPEYADAIVALKPGCAFGIELNNYSTLYWDMAQNSGVEPPTEEEIKAKLAELHSEWQTEQYRRLRYLEYLSVEEQLALLWDDMDAGLIPGKETSNWYSSVKEIKEKYPKGIQPANSSDPLGKFDNFDNTFSSI